MLRHCIYPRIPKLLTAKLPTPTHFTHVSHGRAWKCHKLRIRYEKKTRKKKVEVRKIAPHHSSAVAVLNFDSAQRMTKPRNVDHRGPFTHLAWQR